VWNLYGTLIVGATKAVVPAFLGLLPKGLLKVLLTLSAPAQL
jgi:hypothetical protein